MEAPDLDSSLPGRERELEELSRLLDGVHRATGNVVLISGEAGIGKTTLVERLGVYARKRDYFVLVGHCFRSSSSRPFAPWKQLRLNSGSNSELLPSLAMIDAAGSQEELFERLIEDIRNASDQRSFVIVLEDIQWADTASLELIRYLARQIPALRVLLVLTWRSDDPEPVGGLREVLPDVIREARAARIELLRLSDRDVHEFVEQQPNNLIAGGDKARLGIYLYERSGGNPFFMTELLRDLTAHGFQDDNPSPSVPSLIKQVIERRIDRLSEQTKTLLFVASVIGQEVPIDVWLAVSGVNEPELVTVVEEALYHHILRESTDGRRVSFTHGLIQETIYSGQVSLRRRAVHRQIAEHLSERHDPPVATVADHFTHAGDSRGIGWLVKSADEALRLYAARDAISAVNRADQLASDTAAELPLEAYRLRASAREMLGEDESARADLTTLLGYARERGDRESECRALIDFGMLWAAYDYQQCGSYLKQALDIAETLPNDSLRAHCMNRLANCQANVGEFEPAIELHAQALKIFERLGDGDGIADTLDLLGTTSFLAGDYAGSRDYLERSIAISRDQANKWRLSSSLALLSNVGGDMDSTFDATTVASRPKSYWIDAGEEALATARDIGWISGEAFALSMLGAVNCARGHLRVSLECAESAEEIAHRINHQQWLISSSLLLGVVWGELLDQGRSEHYLERTLGMARSMGSHLWILTAVAALSNARLQRGDLSGRTLLEPFLQTEQTGRAHGKRAFQFAWAHQLRAHGELDQALAFVDRLLGYNDSGEETSAMPQLLKLKADILTDMNDLDAAADLLDEADRVAHQLGFRAMRWRVLLSRASVETSRGSMSEASRYLDASRDVVGTIAREINRLDVRTKFVSEVERHVQRIRSEIQPAPAISGLSPREIDVLRLVARGNTDAQVAEELFISPRTVARHLQSIYTKLDVHSRTAAVRFALDHDLIRPD
jgi:DNA-binding NarL/FixJ family response regulator/tetratricopeptide (TPR) repeat protein